jgi:hypothetical protein
MRRSLHACSSATARCDDSASEDSAAAAAASTCGRCGRSWTHLSMLDGLNQLSAATWLQNAAHVTQCVPKQFDFFQKNKFITKIANSRSKKKKKIK